MNRFYFITRTFRTLLTFGLSFTLFFLFSDRAYSQKNQTQTDNQAMETYRDYTILGPNDKIKISYLDIGAQGTPIEKSNILTIDQDGMIYHELLGKVSLDKMSVSEAENLLTTKFSQYFTQPQARITIIEKMTENVLLYGEVHRIGIYPIQPNITTVAEFIIQNGGTTPDADISKISVTRLDGTTIIFDMERYLYTNQPVNNIILKDKDKVIVPRAFLGDKYARLTKNYVLQYGNVIEISMSELSLIDVKPAETESYTIDQDGNIFHKLFGSVHLGGLTVDKAQTVLTEMAKRYYREPVLRINVIELSSRNVFIFGQVQRPGIYPLEGNVRLAEFLASIGGLTSMADLKNITVTRKNGSTVVFNMDKFLYKRADKKNIFLEDGDRIVVPNRQRGFFVNLSEKLQPFSLPLGLIANVVTILIWTNRIK